MKERSSRLETSPPRVAARFSSHSTRPNRRCNALSSVVVNGIYEPNPGMSLSYRYVLDIGSRGVAGLRVLR